MDELLTLGCIVLFFALVVVPGLAIVAFRRSAAVRSELMALRRRVEELELRGVAQTSAVEPTAAKDIVPADAPTAAMSSVSPEPVTEPPPEPVNTWVSQPKPDNAAVSTPDVERPSAFGGVMSSLVRWFMQGNPLAKLGILLLFLGLSFLLRYTVEHSLFPLELRLVAAALFAIVLLALGWRLRHKQPIYALILQGELPEHSISLCLARSGCGKCCQ